MRIASALWGLAALAAVAAVQPASAVTFRYAFQGDIKSLDPYTLKETFTIAAHGAVYEGLTTRDKNLKIVPALAESWETPEPTRWRFHLRHGVKFHDGSPFTADDVVFSAERVGAPGSNFQTNVPANAKVVKVDDYTVDFITPTPNPILHYQFDNWYIMSKKWCEEHDAVKPTPAAATTPSYASLHENGTGPFTIESHPSSRRAPTRCSTTGTTPSPARSSSASRSTPRPTCSTGRSRRSPPRRPPWRPAGSTTSRRRTPAPSGRPGWSGRPRPPT